MSDTTTEQRINLRFLPMDADRALTSLLSDNVERQIMRRLGITPAEGRSQLHRWLEAMAEENGVDLDTIRHQVRTLRDPVSAMQAGVEWSPTLSAFIFAIA